MFWKLEYVLDNVLIVQFKFGVDIVTWEEESDAYRMVTVFLEMSHVRKSTLNLNFFVEVLSKA